MSYVSMGGVPGGALPRPIQVDAYFWPLLTTTCAEKNSSTGINCTSQYHTRGHGGSI